MEQSRAQHKENKQLKAILSLIFDLVQRLLLQESLLLIILYS